MDNICQRATSNDRTNALYIGRIKRLVDIVLSFFALLVCMPFILIACIFISLESPGNPIFKQTRIGKDGKEFEILKLRTMCSTNGAGPVSSDEGDPRVTRLGSVLRRTKLDELPQFINVLNGDMSLIGPRPLSKAECDYLENEHGFARNYPGFIPRVAPGLLGLEQVNRHRKLTYVERFAFDHNYERDLSWQLDVHIVLQALQMYRHACLALAIGAAVELTAWSVWMNSTPA